MPHIIVKLYPGRPEETKQILANKINQAVLDALNIPDEAISVGIEEVAKEDWDKQVKQVDIVPKLKNIYKHSKSSRVG